MKLVAVFLALGLASAALAESAATDAAESGTSGFSSAKDLRAQFKQACANCHERRLGRAPRKGVRKHWEHRLVKGMPQLVQNVKQGYGSMPPLGMCFDCSDKQFEELIDFMAR